MPDTKRRHPVDVAVALLAEQQDNYFARWQARACGASRSLVSRRTRSEDWVEHAEGAVLSYRGVPRTARGDLRIALLSMGPVAMVGFESAAALAGVEGFRLGWPTILVPHGAHHESSIATIHQTRHLPNPVTMRGFPATPLLRTCVDLASVVAGPVRMGRIVDELVVRFGVTLPAIQDMYEWTAKHHRPGADVLRSTLEGRTYGYVPSRSELERLLDAITATIPGVTFEREVTLPRRAQEPHRVDRLLRQPPLILEGDGRLWHARLAQMEKDRKRDRAALALGYPTARYGWWELNHEAREIRAELLDIIRPEDDEDARPRRDDHPGHQEMYRRTTGQRRATAPRTPLRRDIAPDSVTLALRTG